MPTSAPTSARRTDIAFCTFELAASFIHAPFVSFQGFSPSARSARCPPPTPGTLDESSDEEEELPPTDDVAPDSGRVRPENELSSFPFSLPESRSNLDAPFSAASNPAIQEPHGDVSAERSDSDNDQHEPRRPRRVTAKPFFFDPHAYTLAQNADESAARVLLSVEELSAPTDLDPTSYEKALSSQFRKNWLAAIEKELANHRRNGTWRFDRRPKDKALIGCRYVFKTKRGPAGEVLRFKARLVAQGFRQRAGVDYGEIFSPCPRWTTIRLVMALAAARGLALRHLDVDAAYLVPALPEDEVVFMRTPEGVQQPPGTDCVRLVKCLYGLKKSGRHWHLHLRATLIKMGFRQSEADPCLFLRDGGTLLILMYVDDLMIAGPDKAVEEVVTALKAAYELTDHGQLAWFLGCAVDYDRDNGTLALGQPAYIADILHRANMGDCKATTTPMVDRPSEAATPPSQEEEAILRKIPFREVLGALLYLSTCTRPDITFAVNQIARFTSRPRLEHWTALKRVLRYLQGTRGNGLLFRRSAVQEALRIDGYADADWAGDATTRKSTSGFIFTAAGAAIAWRSQAQRCVALSTAEAELIALTEGVKEAA